MKYGMIATLSLSVVILFLVLAGCQSHNAGLSAWEEAESVAGGSQEEARPVVVELFTSEGCSSCPPPDRLLARLQREQPVSGARIIGLSEHVDYWDRLGWKDTYSSHQFSQRQQDFMRSWGSKRVYTPQMVVDGMPGFVGSDRRKALQAIARAARLEKVRVEVNLKTPIEVQTGEMKLLVRVDDLDVLESRNNPLQVLLAVTEENLHSNVLAGENVGRRISHAAVVRHLQVIGTIRDQQEEEFVAEPSLNLPSGWKRNDLTVVVLVQEKDTRRIVGAAAQRIA